MSIGRAAVLGVLADGLLLEHRGWLRYIARVGAGAPGWQMIWGSPYDVVVSAASAPPILPRYSQSIC